MIIKQLLSGLQLYFKCRLLGKTPDVTYTLDELLAGSSESSLSLNKEDREWLNDKPVGKEAI